MSATAPVYALYGWRVLSEAPLPAPLAAAVAAPNDVEIRWGEVQPAAPERPVIARLLLEGGRGYTLSDTGEGYHLSFHQTAEFAISPDLRQVRLQLHPGVEPGIAGLLVIGNLLACLLTLAGEPALHASAVTLDGAALAFVGRSGMGKSSLAALFCAQGARLLTDDLLRLQADAQGALRCCAGASHLRLRPDAAMLAERLPQAERGAAADGRLTLRLDDPQDRPALAAIVIPQLARQYSEFSLQRIAPNLVPLYLAAFPRVAGLQPGPVLQRQFDAYGRIAACVPMFAAQIPWGLPFPPELAAALVEGVGLRL
jgi:hypothetical protein